MNWQAREVKASTGYVLVRSAAVKGGWVAVWSVDDVQHSTHAATLSDVMREARRMLAVQP